MLASVAKDGSCLRQMRSVLVVALLVATAEALWKQDQMWVVDSTPTHADYEATKIMDGDVSTFWNPSAGRYSNNWYIEFDLGSVQQLTEVRFHTYGDGTHDIKTAKLQTATTRGGTFQDIGTFSLASGVNGVQVFAISDLVQTQHIKLLVTETHSGWQPYLREMMLTVDEAATTTPVLTTSPVATTIPAVTTSPLVITTPVATTIPVATTTAMLATTPVATTTPVSTTTPLVTTTPVATTTLEATTTLVTTTPETTTTLLPTTTPVVTTSPAATSTPAPTTTPATTTAAAATTTPAVATTPATTTTLKAALGGECFGWDSRCRVDKRRDCKSAARLGADCVWYKNSKNKEGVCLGWDSRCQGAVRNKCRWLIRKNTGDKVHDADCEWFRKPKRTSTGLCWGPDSRCAEVTSQYSKVDEWKMEITCKWQVTKGANCQWLPAGSAGKCSGQDHRCAGTADMTECYNIGKCTWSAEEEQLSAVVTLKPAPSSDALGVAGGNRRLEGSSDVADLGVQLAVKQGIASRYTNVEPYEIAITKSEMQGEDIKLDYSLTVVGTPRRSTASDDEMLQVTNEALDAQSMEIAFTDAKVEAVTTKRQTRVFSLEGQSSSREFLVKSSAQSTPTPSGSMASPASSEPSGDEGSEMVSSATTPRGMLVLTFAATLASCMGSL